VIRDARLPLSDMFERIQRIEAFTADGREAFLASELVQDAVIRNFEVIGEAVERMPPGWLDRRPEVPWADYARFRDVLAHQYEMIRLERVWTTVETELPSLRAAVEALRAQADAETAD